MRPQNSPSAFESSKLRHARPSLRGTRDLTRSDWVKSTGKRGAQLFLFPLALFLKAQHIVCQLLLQRFNFVRFAGRSSLFDLVRQEDFTFGDSGAERRINFG